MDTTQIENIIRKYTSGFQKHYSSRNIGDINGNQSPNKVIALSGSTGNAGCYVLEKLLKRQDVLKIFLLNRKGKLDQQQRIVAAFKDKKLDPRILDGSADSTIQVVYLEVDFSRADLGLSMAAYLELQNSLTHILHFAWELNYSAPLCHFETVHIAGIRHLLDLALSSPQLQPPRFFFVSSAAGAIFYSGPSSSPSIGDTDGQPLVPEAPIEDSYMAVPQGYSQSKYVAERVIVEAVKADTGLRATVSRVGQLSGSTETGVWPIHEYLPEIIRSIMLLGVIPDIWPSVRRWVPIDVGASALIKQAFEDSSDLLYFSVENPFPCSWEEILSAMNKLSSNPLRVVPIMDWADFVETAQAQGKQVPIAPELLYFIRGASSVPVMACMSWENSIVVAPELAQCKITKELLEKYLRYQMK